MEFPHSYFEDEVRDGFYVPGEVKRAWAAQLEVLQELDRICRKHDIQWFADCGTLLGAVRHGGFIPWDDDVDICMTRDNYQKFLAVVEKEITGDYSLVNFYKDEDFSEFLTRLVNTRRINFDKEHLQKFHEFPFSAGVDIFPLDYVAPNSEQEEFRKQIVKIVTGAYSAIMDEKHMTEENLQQICQVEELCGVKLERNHSIKQQLCILIDNLFSLYGKEEAEEVALMMYWVTDDNHTYPKACFESQIRIPFETMEIPVPVLYDKVLRIEYGNYMKISKNGGVHDYPFYKKQEVHLERTYGIKPLKYHFSEEDLLRREAHSRKDKIKDVTECIAMLRIAHENLKTAMQEQNTAEVLDLLGACQKCAIGMGSVIETLKGEGFQTVTMLEEYCEQVYQVHAEAAQSGQADAENVYRLLDGVLKRVEESVRTDIKERREVVFLTFKASAWDMLDRVWREAEIDPLCDVYVVPIPYFERRADRSLGEMHYEIENYPDYVPITSCEEYHIEERLPDVIIIQNPYDEYNCTTSVHPAFYSKSIKNYTEKLVYIPYFTTDEIKPEEEKAVFNLDYYAVMPGVVHADRVIVQSEQMKQMYVEKLTEAAGEDTRHIWEEKILGLGLTKEDRQSTFAREYEHVPEKWLLNAKKEDGSHRKVVLYYIGLSEFLQYKEQMIAKMRDVFRIISENREDVIVLWKLHPLIKITLEQSEQELYQQYCQLEQEFCERALGICADDEPDEELAAFCDAYYGDASALAQMCRRAGKPIMLQNCKVRGKL